MNAVAAWLKDEVALTAKAKALGIPRQITHDEAVLAYRRAAEEIEMLHGTLDDLRAAVEKVPEMQNRDKFLDLGIRVNKALGR